eukprot:scaffold574_cov333-Pavlova_lutheri.AAC.24
MRSDREEGGFQDVPWILHAFPWRRKHCRYLYSKIDSNNTAPRAPSRAFRNAVPFTTTSELACSSKRLAYVRCSPLHDRTVCAHKSMRDRIALVPGATLRAWTGSSPVPPSLPMRVK